MVLLFLSLPIILHFCLATQQSDELRIKIDSKFARRQATDLYTLYYRSVRQTPSILHARQASPTTDYFVNAATARPPAASTLPPLVFADRLRKSVQRDVLTIIWWVMVGLGCGLGNGNG